MINLPLFNLAESRRQKERGMEIATAYPNDNWLKKAQATAQLLAAQRGECTIDDVLKVCPRPSDVSPATTGSVFAGKKWQCVGISQSSQTQRHAGLIRRWALKNSS